MAVRDASISLRHSRSSYSGVKFYSGRDIICDINPSIQCKIDILFMNLFRRAAGNLFLDQSLESTERRNSKPHPFGDRL